jgi:hypothetical protein
MLNWNLSLNDKIMNTYIHTYSLSLESFPVIPNMLKDPADKAILTFKKAVFNTESNLT